MQPGANRIRRGMLAKDGQSRQECNQDQNRRKLDGICEQNPRGPQGRPARQHRQGTGGVLKGLGLAVPRRYDLIDETVR